MVEGGLGSLVFSLEFHRHVIPNQSEWPEEHTSPIFAATVHGAYQSGQRAADDIINGMPTASAPAIAKQWSVSLVVLALLGIF